MTDVTFPLSIQCEYTLEDITEFTAAARRRIRKVTLPFWGIYIIIIICFFCYIRISGVLFGPSVAATSTQQIWYLWFALLLAVLILRAWWRRRMISRQFDYFGPLQRPHTFEFQADRLLVLEPLSRHEYQWDAFDRSEETSNLFLLYTAEYSAYVVTKRSFSSVADIAAFRDLLRERIDQARTSRQAFPVIPVATVATREGEGDNPVT